MTDIKLGRNNVVVEGSLMILGPDLKLAGEDRKISSNSEPDRRALTHERGDRLVINKHDDYLGVEISGRGIHGIKLNGNVAINGTKILEIINGLQETVGKLIENQDILSERIKELEIKAGLRPSRVIESWNKANKKLLKKIKVRIPIGRV